MASDLDAIYVSPLGTKYDPLTLYRNLLLQSGNKINDLLTQWQDQDPLTSAQAEESLVALVRSVFGLKGIAEQGGVTDSRVLETLKHYLEFAGKKG